MKTYLISDCRIKTDFSSSEITFKEVIIHVKIESFKAKSHVSFLFLNRARYNLDVTVVLSLGE